MANNQITPFQLTDQFTMDNFNQRINETNTALQKKADLGENGKVPAEQVDAYSQSDSISAGTRTALSLPETATPDAALAEIARQLSESGGLKMDLLWENASPTSTFPQQTITVDNLRSYDLLAIQTNTANYTVSNTVLRARQKMHFCSLLTLNSDISQGFTLSDCGTIYRSGDAYITEMIYHDVKVVDNSIIFNGAFYSRGSVRNDGTTISSFVRGYDTGVLVPILIYGIKLT